jgi:hypothetical protein
MSGTMSRADLVADLKASLHDAAEVFTAAGGADFARLLDLAALDFARPRPRTLIGSVLLTAGTADYALPDDFHAYKTDLWIDPGRAGKPWEKHYAGPAPRIAVAFIDGVQRLIFFPAPTWEQIAAWGSAFRYYYFARHLIGEAAAQTTLDAGDRGLLLLRAQAEAMRELAMRNIGKPVALRDGLNSAPRNGTPAALYQALLDEFRAAA